MTDIETIREALEHGGHRSDCSGSWDGECVCGQRRTAALAALERVEGALADATLPDRLSMMRQERRALVAKLDTVSAENECLKAEVEELYKRATYITGIERAALVERVIEACVREAQRAWSANCGDELCFCPQDTIGNIRSIDRAQFLEPKEGA